MHIYITIHAEILPATGPDHVQSCHHGSNSCNPSFGGTSQLGATGARSCETDDTPSQHFYFAFNLCEPALIDIYEWKSERCNFGHEE
jgi:hypothetical protein